MPQPTRAAASIRNLLDDFTTIPGPIADTAALLAVFDQAGWRVQGYELRTTAEGDLTILRFASAPPRATLRVPALPLSASVGLPAANGAPALQVLRDASGQWLQVGELAALVDVDTALLRPLDAAESAVRIEARFAVHVGRDWSVALLPRAAISLPWCRVAGLPVDVKLDDVVFDLPGVRLPADAAALELDISFAGLHAEAASLRLLPELAFGAQRGVELRAQALALTKRGLSVRLGYYWQLRHDGHAIDPASELVATLFDGLAVGLERIEVDIREGLPRHFLARGVLQLPLLATLLGVEFGLQPRPGGAVLHGRLQSLAPITIDLGPAGRIDIARVSVEGDVEADRLALLGQVDQLALTLGAVALSAGNAELRLYRTSSSSELTVHVGDVRLGPLGLVPGVELVVRETRGPDGTTAREAHLAAQIAWRDVRDRVAVPVDLPTPPDDAMVAVEVAARDSAAGIETVVTLSATVSELDFGSWLPAPIRPEVRNVSLVLSLTYTGTAFADADATGALAAAASGAMQMRLPDLSFGLPRSILNVTTGDAQGWVSATFRAGVDAAGQPFFDVAVSDALGIEVQFPGLPQPQAPIRARLDSLAMQIRDTGVAEGALVLAGRLELRPIVPPRTIPIARHVEQMFAALGVTTVAGDCELALRFREGRLMAELAASFDDTELEVDLFGVLANLASGRAATNSSAGVPLSLEAGIHLASVRASVGSLDAATTGLPFAVEIVTSANVGSLAADCVFSFSDDEVRVGIRGQETSPGRWNTDIPLSLPRLPVRGVDLDIVEAHGWDVDAYRAERGQQLATALGVADLEGDSPPVVRARGELEAATFLLRQVATLRSSMHAAARPTFTQLWIRSFVTAVEALTGWMSNDSDVRLRLQELALTLPLADPRNLGITGSLVIVGFAPDDPLFGVENTRLAAGISPDLIYFQLEGTGDPFELPGIGRYTNSTVSLGELRIGYGYTSNSFNVVVDGTFVPPPALVADLDTSEELGVGIRWPSRNALYFRLGVIPVPGPVPAVPVFDLNLDLRSPTSPALVDAARAIPFWDGLQVIVDDFFRVDLKHVAVSPMLGPLPIVNIKYDGDWLIGNDDLGFTVIADNVHVLLGVGMPPTVIPYFADPGAPYFDNLVLNVRLAGFRLNVNVQHPFPSFNPLALLELFALLSDPSVPLDPNGALANVLRLSVRDVHVELPPWARRLFPQADARVEKPGAFTLNVGTAVSALQALLSVGVKTVETVTEAGSSLQHALHRLPELVIPDVDAILAALPPELRKVRLGGAFAGFECRAVILLISPGAAQQALRERDDPAPTATPPALHWGSTTPVNGASAVPLPLGTRGARESHPGAPAENLFHGLEFAAFDAAALDGLHSTSVAALVIAAHVKVFEAQRFRFLGVLAADGSFSLASALDVRPLRLRVAGIDVRLPFEAAGRMQLQGRAHRDGFHGRIVATGFAEWEPLPGLLSIALGSREKPVGLELHAAGAFRVRGQMHAQLLAAELHGSLDASHTHCFVSGAFSYTAGSVRIGGERKTLIAFGVSAEGRIGPGAAFRLVGDGSLRILDQSFAHVRAVIADHFAQVTAELDTGPAAALTGRFPMAVAAKLSGSIDLRRRLKPSFSLGGQIEASVFDFSIKGAGYIASRGGTDVRLGVEGSLFWGGHEWLGGFLEVGTTSLRVGGRTRFAFPLTHPGTGNAQFAHLFCQLDIGGRFRLDTDRGLASWRADASCLLGLRLPHPSNQFIPLASYRATGRGSTELRLRIVNFRGFEVPGLSSIDIEVPRIVDDGSVDVDLVTVGVPGLLEIGIPYLEGTPGPDPDEWIGYIDRVDFMNIPLLSLDGTTTVNLGKLISNAVEVFVTFRDGDLVLEVVAGGETVPVTLVDVTA